MNQEVKSVNHQQVVKLLHNKFVVVLGDSIQRGVYKDLVLLLQNDRYLTTTQLRSKGERNFLQDWLVEGGCLNQLHNGTEYREVRQYQSDHHLVRFYFITRVYSSYMKTILNDFRRGPKPDVLIINSCVWDISRYGSVWEEDYKENLHQFFDQLNGILPPESLLIWNVTMPLGEKIRGGFLVPEIEHKAPQLRSDVIEANFFSGTLADGYGLDVLDLHFLFRFSLQHRAKDGVHWNAIAHRSISWILLRHMAQAWGITLPTPTISVENLEKQQRSDRPRQITVIPRVEAPLNFNYPPNYFYSGSVVPFPPPPNTRKCIYEREEFCSDATTASHGFISFEQPCHWSYPAPHGPLRPANPNLEPLGVRLRRLEPLRPFLRMNAAENTHPFVMKSRQRHHYYTPYSYHRPPQHY